MQKKIFILSIFVFFIWVEGQQLQAQGSIRGRITEFQTGKPLPRANVFLSGTKIGGATNEDGYYTLSEIPAGGYRLVVSIIGYKQKAVDIVLGPNKSINIDFKLKPVVYRLPELYVRNLDEKWKQNLHRFTEHFIGRLGLADSVTILNPEVLVFDKSWWGRLSAKTLAPLKIKNKALGYIITYHLKEFNQSGGVTRWDGEPFFAKMSPVDSAQAAYWKHNRRKAFYGSLRHFLLALINHRVHEEGFVIYNKRQNTYGYSPNQVRRISASRIIKRGEKDFLYELNFFGRLKIIYLRDGESPEYVYWLPTYRPPRDVQTSYLDLNKHPVKIDINGEIILPYAATQYGYFSFQRLAYLTPKGYRPDEY